MPEHIVGIVKLFIVVTLGTASPELVSILLAELQTPLADRFVAHDHAPCKEQLFYVAIADGKPIVEPDGIADDFLWEAMPLVQ
jgi:hypothetical protein